MPEHRVDQRGEWERRARKRIAQTFAGSIHDLEWGRFIDAPFHVGWSGWRRQRSIEFISGGSLRAGSCVRIRRCEDSGEVSPEIVPALQGFVHRTKSGPGKNRARVARRDVRRMPITVVRDDGTKSGPLAQNA